MTRNVSPEKRQQKHRESPVPFLKVRRGSFFFGGGGTLKTKHKGVPQKKRQTQVLFQGGEFLSPGSKSFTWGSLVSGFGRVAELTDLTLCLFFSLV